MAEPVTDEAAGKRLPPKEMALAIERLYATGGQAAVDEFLRQQAALEPAEQAPSKKKRWFSESNSISPDKPGEKNDAVQGIIPENTDFSEVVQKAIKKAPVDHTKAPSVSPSTIKEANLILQPKSSILGKYSFGEWQEDIMTLIMEQLQGRMSTSLSALKQDVIGEITLRVDCSVIAGDDKKKILGEIDKMMKDPFEFWWQSDLAPSGTAKVETKGVLISTYHNYVGTSYVDLVINKWALPFLLYFGRGIGANRFRRDAALVMSGRYTKRLYKLLAGYVDRGSYDYPIAAMRTDYKIPESYTTASIKRSIIEPAVKQINAYAEDFEIEAEFRTMHPELGAKKKQAFDTIHFTIRSTAPESVFNGQEQKNDSEVLGEVYSYLSSLVDSGIRSKLLKICETWSRHGDLRFVYSKILYYDKMMKKQLMTRDKMKNYLFKALESETHVQLRTSRKHHTR